MHGYDRPLGAELPRRYVLGSLAAVTGAVVVGAGGITGSRVAHADTGIRIHDREQWKARAPRRSARVLGQRPDRIVIHHTASANTGDHSRRAAYQLSRAIQQHHMDTNGWDDVGQQFTISRGGYVMEGRNRSLHAVEDRHHVVGAHTLGENDHTLGIENEGTYMSTTPPDDLWDSLVALCGHLCDRYGLSPALAIVGHRDYNATACPGDELYAMLPALRLDVAATMALRHVPPDPDDLLKDQGEDAPGPRFRFDHGPAAAVSRD